MAVTTVHAQLIRYTDSGNQVIINLKNSGSDVSLTRSNTNIPTSVSTVQGLANSLGALAFKSSLSKSDVGLGNVDNTADSSKSVKYAASAGNADTLDGVHSNAFSANHAAGTWDYTTGKSSSYVTFDVSEGKGGPGSWVNGFVSTHNNYLSSYIVNVHRTPNWYVGYNEYHDGGGSTAPVWNLLIHSGNYTQFSPTKTGSGASGTWGINVTGNAATATKVKSMDFLKVQKETPTEECIWCKID